MYAQARQASVVDWLNVRRALLQLGELLLLLERVDSAACDLSRHATPRAATSTTTPSHASQQQSQSTPSQPPPPSASALLAGAANAVAQVDADRLHATLQVIIDTRRSFM